MDIGHNFEAWKSTCSLTIKLPSQTNNLRIPLPSLQPKSALPTKSIDIKLFLLIHESNKVHRRTTRDQVRLCGLWKHTLCMLEQLRRLFRLHFNDLVVVFMEVWCRGSCRGSCRGFWWWIMWSFGGRNEDGVVVTRRRSELHLTTFQHEKK